MMLGNSATLDCLWLSAVHETASNISGLGLAFQH
jgi:hypothetical protein